MSSLRVTWRWLLTLVALVMLVVAVLAGGLRLLAWQSDRLSPWLLAGLETQLDANAELDHLSLAVDGWRPRLTLAGFTLASRRGATLLDVERAQAEFEPLASWRQGMPVFEQGRLDAATLHLYQNAQGRWGWPDGAGARWFGDDRQARETGGGVEADSLLRLLAHQRLRAKAVTLVLHGREREARLSLSELTLASRDGRASLQAALTRADHAAGQLHLAIDAGSSADAPDARGIATLDLDELSPVLAVASAGHERALTAVEGDITLAGHWQNGGLRAGQLSLEIPALTLTNSPAEAATPDASTPAATSTLTDLGVEAHLSRGDDNRWHAWLNGLRGTLPETPELDWPQRLQASETADGWWLRSAPFDLDGLARLIRYLPLPTAVSRTLVGLAPRGHVAGLELGRADGEWYAQAALEGAAVNAWDEIPGGGPIDAWATFRGRGGSVTFAGASGTQFRIPEVYAEPLVLSSARGQIDWSLTADGAVISGEGLSAGWRGATATGRFGLSLFNADDKPGAFLLDLTFADADARRTRVLPWLPTRVIEDPELQTWLGGDIGGIVRRGSLGLAVTLSDRDAPEGRMFVNPNDRLSLSLDIEDGRLQYAPDWPALERVDGHLEMHNMALEAQVDHATSHGLTTRNAEVRLADKQLAISGDVAGSSGGLLDFLANAPLQTLSQSFALWQSQGQVQAHLDIGLPMDQESDIETDMTVDVQGVADIASLTFPELNLTLGDIGGDLRYRRERGEDYLTGTLDARAFEGPLQARFAIGGADSAIDFDGEAQSRGLLDWAGMSRVAGLLDGGFPYTARIAFDAQDNASLRLRSDLEPLAIALPPPFGKRAGRREPLAIDADISAGTGSVMLGDWGRARWRTLGQQAQGQVWLEGWPGDEAAWPSEPGWYVLWRPNRLDTQRWAQALSQLRAADDEPAADRGVPTSITEETLDADTEKPVNDGGGLKRVALSTPCILVDGRCLGGLQVDAAPLADGWRLSLDGEIAAGHASWQPSEATPIDIDLARLNLDALTPDAPEEASASTGLMSQVEVAPPPVAMPDEIGQVPAGHLHVARFERKGQQFGPLEARWQADARQLQVTPLSLTLGEVAFDGGLTWSSAGEASLTRARLQMSGGDLGSAFRVMDQPVPVNSETTEADLQLSWPGAPWQFALPRVSGRAQATLTNGRFRQIHSSGAKLVGLFNLDNVLRRLQLDFSDVTSGGTAFNRVDGSATLYNGTLKSEGPIVVDGTSTRFTLAGSVDLNRQSLDQRLGITVPVSQNLPLVAVMAGAPQVGLGLFVFHKLFGRWLDSVTQIYYRIEGPWSSPTINLESAQ
ncbi:YhdP family phospholipid transporter [Salinicola avicenniae]|uniref:YhdP family phospholipid transporter n=1 Tax=Salinicola avicenniae TaxID=2916836 RepID=UPI00207462F1|nr:MULTISPECIES: AsmA-like C-terminal region-containing protein [unclassified Salinicola]